jgi:hypothetical protein
MCTDHLLADEAAFSNLVLPEVDNELYYPPTGMKQQLKATVYSRCFSDVSTNEELGFTL